MSTIKQAFRSNSGFVSPYFIVDAGGNLLTKTVTVAGNRLELAKNSYISYNGSPLLTGTTLGSTVTNITGTLTGLTIAGDINITGNINIAGAVRQSGGGDLLPGEINNVNIGNTTPGIGRFTTLSSTGTSTVSFTPTGSVTISPTGAVTISPTGSVTIAPTGAINLGTLGQPINLIGNLTAGAGQNVNFTLSGTSTFVLNSIATSSIDNTQIGITTPAAAKFTLARVTANDELFGNDVTQVSTKRYTENAFLMGYFVGVSAR